MDSDPRHPVIDRPCDFEIGEFRYHVGLDGSEPHIDLSLQRGTVVRRLRFWSPQDLKIEEGFPKRTGGLAIMDVRGRQLDGVGVWVTDFEASLGTMSFWARSVVDLDAPGTP